MSLMRFYGDPLTESDRVFDDELATRFRPSVSAGTGRTSTLRVDLFRPRINVHESKDNDIVTATFEVPSMKSDDITVDNDSTFTGTVSPFLVSYGKFSRMLQLPFATKPDDLKAKMENGVLTVTFPKTTPEQQVQRIVIQ